MSQKKSCICGKNHDNDIIITITHCNKHNPTSEIYQNKYQRQHSDEKFVPKHASSDIICKNSTLKLQRSTNPLVEKNPSDYGLVMYCEEDNDDSGGQGDPETICVLNDCPIEQLVAILEQEHMYYKSSENICNDDSQNEKVGKFTPWKNILKKKTSRSRSEFDLSSKRSCGCENYESDLNRRHSYENNIHKDLGIDNNLLIDLKQKLKPHKRAGSDTSLTTNSLKKHVKIKDSGHKSKDPPLLTDEDLSTKGNNLEQNDMNSVNRNLTPIILPDDNKQNFPPKSDVLPTLPSRYHGPGCCMEINVLEKHDHGCRYIKQKNPHRNLVDDSAGSYEVIGRLNFKTCDITPVDNKDQNNSNLRDLQLYNLLAIPKIGKLELLESVSDKQFDILRKYIKRSKLLESLVHSSKSFPKHSQYIDIHNSNISILNNENSTGKKDIEELFFHCTKKDQSSQISRCDKAIQMSGVLYRPYKQKKWFYFFFSCIFPKGKDNEIS